MTRTLLITTAMMATLFAAPAFAGPDKDKAMEMKEKSMEAKETSMEMKEKSMEAKERAIEMKETSMDAKEKAMDMKAKGTERMKPVEGEMTDLALPDAAANSRRTMAVACPAGTTAQPNGTCLITGDYELN